MTNVVIETAMQRARFAALVGPAPDFAQAMQAVLTLDRGGEASARELRMLALVAAARCADLTSVDLALRDLGPLAPSDWRILHQWLLAAPEMQHEAYASFVRALNRRIRPTMARSPMRRVTAGLALLLVASILSLLVLAWRLAPREPSDMSSTALEGLLAADPGVMLQAMPDAWATVLRDAVQDLSVAATAERVATERDASMAAVNDLAKSVERMATAIERSASRTSTTDVACQVLGPDASVASLRRLATGLRTLGHGPWTDVRRWHDEGIDWAPDPDAQYAARVILRHAPLGLWFPGLASADLRCDPDRVQRVFASTTSRADEMATVLVQVGSQSWHTPVTRVGRDWAPHALVERWAVWEPSLRPEACTPDTALQLQTSITRTASSLAAWIGRVADGEPQTAPPVSEIPWWVP